MKRICRWMFFACLTGLILFMIPFWAYTEEDTLILPLTLDYIKEAAFSGVAAEKVVVPEGTTEIHKRAFANSALTEVVLPSSLTYIADDAFEGCPEGLRVSAEENTYAYDWADEKGYIYGPLKELVIELPLSSTYEIDITQPFQIPYHTVPNNTSDKILWESTDPEVGTVDDNGLVTPLKQGFLNIWAYKYNNEDTNKEYIVMVGLRVIGDFYQSDCLKYTLTSDGTGYCVSGCTGDPERIMIPAFHNGLPVVGFEPGAFKDCTNMTDIALEEGHAVLYIENASLYADLPQKTLLYHPGRHFMNKHYNVAEGTEAIVAYAFAHSYLRNLTIPEGVVSIGNCAFYKLPWPLSIYMPNSLTEFGNFLFQSQTSNAVFYVKDRSVSAAEYAKRNNIPCGIIIQRTPEPTMAPTPTPTPGPTAPIPELDDGNVVVYDKLYYPSYEYADIRCFYNISELESDDVTEVRLAIKDQWRDMAYYPEMAQQTGLYGAGYTEQKAILRAYDKFGCQIGAKWINGDFIFSFDGACTLGVSGGKGTSMTVVPTKPIFITSPGRYPVQPSQWHSRVDGDLYQHYIIAMSRGLWSRELPQHLNIVGANSSSCRTFKEVTSCQEYIIVTVITNDGSRAQQIDQHTFIFDTSECLLDNDKLLVYAASLPKKSEDLGASINEAFIATMSEMIMRHIPDTLSVNKVQVYIDGSYPSAYMGRIVLDNQFFEYDDSDACTLFHEFTHAIDQSLKGTNQFEDFPDPWMEGRAEYVSKDICEKQNLPYTSSDYGNGKDYNWGFLSKEDREDFFRFYCESTNRETTYSVGYYFYDFLIDTYGSSVGAEIMLNAVTMPYDASEGMEFFKKCVEAATEVGVFQRFVNDVIIPSGT